MRTTMTCSILGCHLSDGALGVAVQSEFPGVGSLVPYGEADVGVVATQAFGNPRHGSSGSALLRCGAPGQAVEVLLNDDALGHDGGMFDLEVLADLHLRHGGPAASDD
jgi:uncharacterized Ntn-hydrolase superfamily protein